MQSGDWAKGGTYLPLPQPRCVVMRAWPGQGAECQSNLQLELIECMGEGEGKGLPESSLEGKGSFISVVGRNGAPYKTPQEIGEDSSSFRPPRFWLFWAPCFIQVSGWLSVPCPCGQRCWLKVAEQYLHHLHLHAPRTPPSPHPPTPHPEHE